MWRTPKKLGEMVSCGAAISCLLAFLFLMDMVFFSVADGPHGVIFWTKPASGCIVLFTAWHRCV